MVCNVCGGAVLHGNLYCSVACAKSKQEQNDATAAELVEAGFVQDQEALNVYRKDGVSITLEHINHAGLEKVLSHHAAAIRAHALGVRTSEPEAASAEPATHGTPVESAGDIAGAGPETS